MFSDGCLIEIAKVGFKFFWPLALFPIANYDHIRLFQTLREPEITSELGAHLSIPFYCGGGPLQQKGMERYAPRSDMISGSRKVQNGLIFSQFTIANNASGKKKKMVRSSLFLVFRGANALSLLCLRMSGGVFAGIFGTLHTVRSWRRTQISVGLQNMTTEFNHHTAEPAYSYIRRTDTTSYRDARTHLKTYIGMKRDFKSEVSHTFNGLIQP